MHRIEGAKEETGNSPMRLRLMIGDTKVRVDRPNGQIGKELT
jgi:hypothetical protein